MWHLSRGGGEKSTQYHALLTNLRQHKPGRRCGTGSLDLFPIASSMRGERGGARLAFGCGSGRTGLSPVVEEGREDKRSKKEGVWSEGPLGYGSVPEIVPGRGIKRVHCGQKGMEHQPKQCLGWK